MANELVDALTRVFGNVDEDRRARLIAWASEELGSRSVITLLVDADGVEYKIGEASPSNKDVIVFAMLYDGTARAVDVYSAGFVVEEGSGKEGVLYFKETCWNPKHTWGPISVDALYTEWETFFAEPDDPEPEPNGAGATQ